MWSLLLVPLTRLQPFFVSASVLQKPFGAVDPPAQTFNGPLSTDVDGDDKALHQLNDTLGGRIKVMKPVGRPCYSIDEYSPFVQNETLCSSIMTSKVSDGFMIDQPSGYYTRTGEACAIPVCQGDSIGNCDLIGNYVSSSAKCHQGNVPDYYIDVQSSSDILKVFKYGRNLSRPIVIKNTGHDIKGRSAAPRALALWTHNLKAPKVPIKLETDFVADGCSQSDYSETVFTVGAGETWGGLYDFANEKNLAVVGGTCGTVGIAGWLHGGGHSPLSTHFGLGVDNVRQVEIVLPSGTKMVANDCQNEDIFRAVKGGGGGTYGVVTEISYKALPKFNVQVSVANAGDGARGTATDLAQEFTLSLWGLDRDGIRIFFEKLTANATYLAERGWGGYINSARGNRSLTLVNPRATQKEAAADVRPLIEYARNLDVRAVMKTHSSWYDYYLAYYLNSTELSSTWGSNDASRLVPRSVFENNDTRSELVDVMLDLHYARLNFIIMPVTPYAFTDPRESSLHPDWRRSPWVVRINDKWDPFYQFATPRTTARSYENVHAAMDRIRRLIKNTGVSINEADIWEPDFADAFWGPENTKRLKDVKKKVDPHSILQTIQGIGADPEDERFRCYPVRSESKPSPPGEL